MVDQGLVAGVVRCGPKVPRGECLGLGLDAEVVLGDDPCLRGHGDLHAVLGSSRYQGQQVKAPSYGLW